MEYNRKSIVKFNMIQPTVVFFYILVSIPECHAPGFAMA